MQWPISRVAGMAGTTSRALRHYERVGLLLPSSVGSNGYRHYDEAALVRLQQILLLRGLGLGLTDIGRTLAAQADPATALSDHLRRLHAEQRRLTDQIRSVELTIERLQRGEQLMPEEAFNGFDHTRYREEVTDRWGEDAYSRSDTWWRSLSDDGRRDFLAEQQAIAAGFGAARSAGLAADAEEVQELARRHYEWLGGIPGTPQTPEGRPTREYFVGLAQMYVADDRFAASYDRRAPGTAVLVRDAMVLFAERTL